MTKAKKTKNKKVAEKKKKVATKKVATKAAAAKKTTTRKKVAKKKAAGKKKKASTSVSAPAAEAQILSAIGGIEKNIRAIDLKHADYNPRLEMSDKEMAELKHSIRSGGFTQRVVVNSYPGRENIIVGGHKRVKALMEMGIESIPCIVVSYDFATEKEMNIRYNKNIGNWDWDILQQNFGEKDLLGWGFDGSELTGLFVVGDAGGMGAEGNGDIGSDGISTGGSPDDSEVDIDGLDDTMKMTFKMSPEQYAIANEKLSQLSDDKDEAFLLAIGAE